MALKRLAHDERFIGAALPGFPGILTPGPAELPFRPHIHSSVPGGASPRSARPDIPAERTAFSVKPSPHLPGALQKRCDRRA